MQKTLSWKLSTDINQTRTLFSSEVLPYTIDSYICSCSHQEIIIGSNFQEKENYICENCENDKFLDANNFLGNVVWYEKIEDIFIEDILKRFEIILNKDNSTDNLTASVVVNIPNGIDLASNDVKFTQKEIYKITIDSYSNQDEILSANFDIDRYQRSFYDFDNYQTYQDLINKHPILSNYKKRILTNIVKNNYYDLSSDIENKLNSIEQLSFFIQNSHLKEFDFYYWDNIEYLPIDKEYTVFEALSYISNNRKEKSLKKAIFSNYKEQIYDKSYYFLYPYYISKYIKDINIAIRLLDLNLNSYFKELRNHNSFELFLIYLTKHYSDKQIEKLLKSYKKQEMFWFLDSLESFAELSDDMIDNFPKVVCRYDILHDEIIQYHRLTIHQRLLESNFTYTQKQKDAVTSIAPYDIKLPLTGLELYNWSNTLSNCLAGYGKLIKNYKTTIYGFCIDDEISFAVEIVNDKIIQSRSKYNKELCKDEMGVVIGWYEEFILEKKD